MSKVPNVNLFLGFVNCLRNTKDQKYIKENFEARRFYSSGKEFDYVKYVNTGSKEKLDYVAYSGNNEKSSGIFNEKGLMSKDDIKELRNKLRETNSTIWHGVISFTEYFGNLNCDNYEKAFDLMKTELPKFFKNANLKPENIVWFAGLHENTDNKHIHFSFFEKEPLRNKRNYRYLQFSDGFIAKETLGQFKIDIEKHFLTKQLNLKETRKGMTECFKKLLNDGAFMKNLKELINVLPERGRLSYDSENMAEFKPTINKIITNIISSNKELSRKYHDFTEILAKRDNELLKAYSKINVKCEDKLLYDKCITDLYRRLGNLVIYTARDIIKAQQRVEYDTRNRLALKRIEKNKRRILMNKCMRLNDLVDREIMSAFAEYRQKLEEANYKRLKEEGYIE